MLAKIGPASIPGDWTWDTDSTTHPVIDTLEVLVDVHRPFTGTGDDPPAMLLSLGLILLCQLLGEAIAHGTGVPIPGPVIGLVLCLGLLLLRDRMGQRVPAELRDGTFENTGSGLLSHLSLLFIPAGVGVIQRLDVLTGNALPIAAAVFASTLFGMTVTALVFTFVARRAR